MISRALNVLLVEDDPDYAGLVQHWLAAPFEDVHFTLMWTDSLHAAVDRLAKGGTDVILLDLGLPDSDGIPTFLEIRKSAPSLPILILSAGDNDAAALDTIRQGAQDYLVKNYCSAELLTKALRYAWARHTRETAKTSSEPSRGPRIAGVLGAKGGVGTTTIACTLAAEMRAQTEGRVLLLDLDVCSGMAAFLLGLDCRYSIVDALGNLGSLDRTMWESLVTPVEPGLDLMSSPGLCRAEPIAGSQAGELVAFARSLYDWIVIDMGRTCRLSMDLLPLVTDLLLVTTPTIDGLREAKRVMAQSGESEAGHEPMRLVINLADRDGSLRASELDKLFEAPVFARLPGDDSEVQRSLMEKRLPADTGGFRKQIRAMARSLAGLEPIKPKKGASPFSFLLKSKSGAPAAVETLK